MAQTPTFNRLIDHAILKSDTTQAQVISACDDVIRLDLFGLAVNPLWNELVARRLQGSNSTLVAVAGFPLGATTTEQKVAEALAGAKAGAGEVDMVANIGWLAAGEYGLAEKEMAQIRRALPDSIALKVIIETPMLTAGAQVEATEAVVRSGAQFVKTATGFFGGATVEAVENLVQAAAGRVAVKASGGVRNLALAEEFVALGVTRLGSSASVAIMAELASRQESADHLRV